MDTMTGFDVLTDDALLDLLTLLEKGAPFTEDDYEACFDEADARDLLEVIYED